MQTAPNASPALRRRSSFALRSWPFVLALCLLPSAFYLSARAQGTAFTYQGRLTDGANPGTGTYDLRFAIYDSAGGATVVAGPVTNSPNGITDGLFTVTLDFGAGVFNGSERWLEVGVRTNGSSAFTTLAPRHPITSTPYAIQAINAASAISVIGPVSAAQLAGTLSPDNIAAGTITGTMLAHGAVGTNQLAAGAVTTAALSDGAVTGAKVHSPFTLFSSVILTNPTPLSLDQFGNAVATLGTDRILVGAPLDDAGAVNAGDAHLFDATGNLLLTLTNPAPASDDNFGIALTGVGTDKLLVGAPGDDTGALNTGSAYFFSTTGALLLTLTNPSPATADGFGCAVTAVGPDRFLIGAFRDNAGAGQFGAAYLYTLSGKLVTTFTNPAPERLDLFGAAVAGVGLDKLLIGAYADDAGAADAGTAYLFSTNGTLLTTMTNPAPEDADNFGFAVSAVGPDRVLIGAPGDRTGASGAGAAYLYDLSGNLLLTYTNPAPATSDQFGKTVAAVGTNRVLIGAPLDDAGALNAGAAYLFDLSGKLLLTITNPTPSASDQFGVAVAAFDANRVVIGCVQDDFEVVNAGGVYVLEGDMFTPGLTAAGVRARSVDTVALAPGAVTTEKIANGAIKPEDLDVPAFASSFWKTDGNAGTSAGSDFIGTTDAVPLVLRANNRTVLQLDAAAGGTRLIVGTFNSLDATSTNSSILGGRGNTIGAGAPESIIVGGVDNDIQSVQRGSFIGGGARNEVRNDNDYAVIVGGRDNRIGTNTVISAILGGAENVMQDNIDGGLMLGGFRNDILGSNDPFNRQIAPILIGGSDNEIGEGRGSSWSIILGGDNNRIGTNCPSAVILGGTNNLVAHNAGFSLGAGRRSRVNHLGAFVWADSQNASFASAGEDTFNIRSQGGMHLNDDTSQFFGSTTRQMLNLYGTSYGIGVQSFTMYFRTDSGFSWYEGGIHSNTQNSPGTGGTEQMRLNSAGLRVNGTFVSASDRNVKAGFTTIDPQEILAKVAALPISRWHYTNDTATPHLGPVAQDFHAAFGVGPDDKHIATVDADGVALAAIQGLNAKVEVGSQRSEVRSQRSESRIQALEAENAELKTRLERLEQLLSPKTGGAQ